MLQLKSFKMSDHDGMNELLRTKRLAVGAHIMTSNGEIIIPFEDGMPMNDDQKIIMNKEEREKLRVNLHTLLHSQDVLNRQLVDIDEQLTDLETQTVTPGSKRAYDAKKDTKAQIIHLTNVKMQRQSSLLQTVAEIDRLNLEISIYDDRIKDLEDFKDVA